MFLCERQSPLIENQGKTARIEDLDSIYLILDIQQN